MRQLSPTHIFPEGIDAGTPDWLPELPLAVCAAPDARVRVLTQSANGLLVTEYTPAGELLATRPVPPAVRCDRGHVVMRQLAHDTYLATGPSLWRVQPAGAVTHLPLPGHATQLAVTGAYGTARVAVATRDGGLLIWPTDAALEPHTETFAEGVELSTLAFLPSGRLIAVGQERLWVYTIRGHRLRCDFEAQVVGQPIAVVPMRLGNDFAVFSRDGGVALYAGG